MILKYEVMEIFERKPRYSGSFRIDDLESADVVFHECTNVLRYCGQVLSDLSSRSPIARTYSCRISLYGDKGEFHDTYNAIVYFKPRDAKIIAKLICAIAVRHGGRKAVGHVS